MTPATLKLLKNIVRLGHGSANARAMGVSMKTVYATADEGLVDLVDLDTRVEITQEGRKALEAAVAEARGGK